MGFLLGIDVGGTKISGCRVDLDQQYRLKHTIKLPTEADKGCDQVLRNIDQVIAGLLEHTDVNSAELEGIGLALPGIVDIQHNISVVCPNLPGFTNLAIGDWLQARYPIPLYIENDAKAAAVAEAELGAGKPYRDFIYICAGTGIGCGLILNGALYRGFDGVAGEIGHTLLTSKLPLYKLASGKALQTIFNIKGETLQERCQQGDLEAIKAFEHLITHMGMAIGNVVTLLNPEAVILGGGMARMGDFFIAPLEAEIRKNAFSKSAARFVWRTAHFEQNAEAIGIALLAARQAKAARTLSHA